MSQLARIQYIIRKLSKDQGVSLKEISQEFEISTRQAGRDIEYLRDQLSGPIVYDWKTHTYRLSGPWVSYTNFDERLTILGAYIKALVEQLPMGYMNEELDELLFSGMTAKSKKLLGKIIYKAPSLDIPDYSVFSTVAECISEGCPLKFSYVNRKGEATERIVDVARMVNYENTWYVIGYDSRREAIRTFHLSRMRDAEVAKDKKTHPVEESVYDEFVNVGFGILHGDSVKEYVMRFRGAAAYTVSSQVWHKDQKMEKTGNGDIILTVPATASEELMTRMFMLAPDAIPLSPPEFVEGYRKKVSALNKKLKALK